MDKQGNMNVWDLKGRLRNADGSSLVWVKVQVGDYEYEAPLRDIAVQPLRNVDSSIHWLTGRQS